MLNNILVYNWEVGWEMEMKALVTENAPEVPLLLKQL